jgi:glutaredoxin
MPAVKVYGADWCPLTKAAIAHLAEVGVDYDYIDIERDKNAAKWVAEHNEGKEKKPTIDVGGTVLSEPSNDELDSVLRERGVLAR